GTVPAREAIYSLELPAGWQYKAVWINHPEQASTGADAQHARWQVSGVKPIRVEELMPPVQALAGRLFISLTPPDGREKGPQDWGKRARWSGERTKRGGGGAAQISKRVRERAPRGAPPLEQMRVLAAFVQRDIRYVAIELGIGSWQPHAATDVLVHGYGDC